MGYLPSHGYLAIVGPRLLDGGPQKGMTLKKKEMIKKAINLWHQTSPLLRRIDLVSMWQTLENWGQKEHNQPEIPLLFYCY